VLYLEVLSILAKDLCPLRIAKEDLCNDTLAIKRTGDHYARL